MHMVTDIIGHSPSMDDKVAGHDRHLKASQCLLAHFHRTQRKIPAYFDGGNVCDKVGSSIDWNQ